MRSSKTFRKTALARTRSLIALPGLLSGAEPAQAALDIEAHSFDCGSTAPPSGPYLDVDLLIVWDYDCSTGGLTNPQIAASGCTYHEKRGVDVFSGFCAVTKNGEASGFFEAFIGLAVLGTYQSLEYTIHSDSRLFSDKSGQEPMTLNGVSYYTFEGTFNHLPCTPSAENAHAHATAWGSSGSMGAAHDQTTSRCF